MSHLPHEEETHDVHSRFQQSTLNSFHQYERLYKQSIEQPTAFWAEQAKTIDWFQPFTEVTSGGFEKGDIKWFIGGTLNAAYNCIDRHLSKRKDQVAILWEGDEPGLTRKVTYGELYDEVNKLAYLLKSVDVQKGDRVTLYMPNIPEAAFAMLACARIGAIHAVIFAGFSPDSVASRIQDASSKVVITASTVRRGGRKIPLKSVMDQALLRCPSVQKVFVLNRDGDDAVQLVDGRDINLGTAMASVTEEQAKSALGEGGKGEHMSSEDPIFILHTSGSTGKPKGLLHTVGGYLLYASLTFRYVFDIREGDVYACVADVGWITGHSYVVYGPLAAGSTTFMFEGVPTYPNPSRYWQLVESHKISQFYTAPTAIRTLMKYGDAATHGDKSSLRVLGSVGEPINHEAWEWYFTKIGNSQCAVVDTYWQTETGGHMITPIPGVTKTKPGSATLPFFGIEPVIVSKEGKRIEGGPVQGVLAFARPWPSIARSVYGDHQRYLETYMKPYPGFFYTGDEAKRDKDGYYWILGRVDDELNVSGHRIGTAELESALDEHPSCAESAVVGFPHDIKGQGIAAFCILKSGIDETKELENELRQQVRNFVGPFATPDIIILTQALPKTRSGKIMRRILRKIAANECSAEQLGDISTLADPDIIAELIVKFTDKMKANK